MKEIVIKISDNMFDVIKNSEKTAWLAVTYGNQLVWQVKNGKVLPKGHGNLKDIGKCDRKLFYRQCGGEDSLVTVKTAFDMLLALPTIIEADEAESEE